MADVQVLVGGSATISETFAPGGVPTDLDASAVPVVTITRPDGSAGPASGTVTRTGTGTYQLTLDAQAEVTVLKAVWTGNISGKLQTLTSRVEVVGDLLFTLPAAKAFDGGAIVAASNAPVPTDADIVAARARITDDFAEILGFSPVPRFAREILDGDGSSCLLLRQIKAHRLISVTVNGVAQTVGSYTLKPAGILEATSGYALSGTFTAGRGNVAVEYAHGDERVDAATSRAALIVAKSQLVRSDVTDRATSLAGPEGGTTFLSTPGRAVGGEMQWYGLPQVDSVLNRRSQRGLAVA